MNLQAAAYEILRIRRENPSASLFCADLAGDLLRLSISLTRVLPTEKTPEDFSPEVPNF